MCFSGNRSVRNQTGPGDVELSDGPSGLCCSASWPYPRCVQLDPSRDKYCYADSQAWGSWSCFRSPQPSSVETAPPWTRTILPSVSPKAAWPRFGDGVGK